MVNKFVEITANKKSIAKRRLVLGVGINDSNYVTSKTINGKKAVCPFYSRWSGMLMRCYSKKYLEKYQAYLGCSVCDDWLTFSVFKIWMKKQNWEGLELDKDVIKPSNKVYSPESCAFICLSLNRLLCDSRAARGRHPQGVYFNKASGKYMAQIKIKGTKKGLGYYPTSEKASKAYNKAKLKIILQSINDQTDVRVVNGLKLHAEILK